ncbi:AAA family ATPase [Rhizobium sp. PL01]|uniref:AAA family ATPase n=1 Tax=Rhizobium sp. PL01 TaxID=3085631 RepID=UPI002981C878|nr:AAA family ATPase [Rhizobium sp. PL01]MDW5313000.1 AAA family ATPase [Rhizobium sp. PL01]
MKQPIAQSEFTDLRKNPGKFMMTCALRRALRPTVQFQKNAKGIILCIVDKGWIWSAKSAATLFLTGGRTSHNYDDFRQQAQVFGVSAKWSKSKSTNDGVTIVRPEHQAIYLAPTLEAFPTSLVLAADEIVTINPPTGRHVKAARRVCGVDDVDIDVADEISRQNADVVIGLAARNSLSRFDASLLREPVSTQLKGPKLSDLPGYGAARPWVADVKQDVADWREGKLAWSNVDKGLLLAGPPGTGKTLFATALAAELGFELISTSVGDWQGKNEGHLGTMLRAMTESFAEASARKGAVLFIDELDSLGDRGRMRDGHAYYEGNVINRFLELVTHLFEQEGVILVGATNHPNLIDPAVLRSGRLESHIYLDLPDEEERAEILAYHLEQNISARELRAVTDKLRLATPADLEKLARKAKRFARGRKATLNIKDVEASLPARVPLPEDVVHRICVHEIGHALMAISSGVADVIDIRVESHMVEGAIVQDGGRMHYQIRNTALPTEKELLAKIRMMLGGAAAEEVVFGTRSIGAGGVEGSDLDQATRLAYRLVGSYGLGKWMRYQFPAKRVDESFVPMPELRVEVDGILAREYRAAKELLAKEKTRLMRLAAELVVDRRMRIEKQ